MRKKRIAFVTCSKFPVLNSDDQSALPVLQSLGLDAEPAEWDAPGVDWKRYDAVVVRSTWNYWLKYDQFLGWVSKVEGLGIPFFNPPEILRGNTRKTYLRGIQAKGVAVLPTHWVEDGNRQPLAQILRQRGWQEAVLKPSLSGGADRTCRISQETAEKFEGALTEILASAEAMIQPLMPTIFSDGELSFLFYGGRYSHAAIKRGSAGEFRIQSTFGGTVEAYEASPQEVKQAEAVIAAYTDPKTLLYARVDCVRDLNDSSRLLLMELEATEPNLFFDQDRYHPGAAQRFAEALNQAIENAREG